MNDPESKIFNLQYYDSTLKGWRKIFEQVTFTSNKFYRKDMILLVGNGPNTD